MSDATPMFLNFNTHISLSSTKATNSHSVEINSVSFITVNKNFSRIIITKDDGDNNDQDKMMMTPTMMRMTMAIRTIKVIIMILMMMLLLLLLMSMKRRRRTMMTFMTLKSAILLSLGSTHVNCLQRIYLYDPLFVVQEKLNL